MNMVIILSEVFCCHGYPTKEAEARGAGQRAGNRLQSEKPFKHLCAALGDENLKKGQNYFNGKGSAHT